MPVKKSNLCKRHCKYRNGCSSWGQSEHGCDYILITGQSRLKIVYNMLGVDRLTPEAQELMRPENCTCFVRSRKYVSARVPDAIEKPEGERDEILKSLHSQGMNDKEIAYHMGVSARSIGTWRRKLGLESNFKQ